MIRQIIELYLNGQRVDLIDNGGIYLNYKIKDVKNPTIVKNMFSKTLDVPGTDNNNQIFNNIWELTRTQTSDIVPYFNQSKRVGFELFLDGELIEQGYCKMDSIKRDGPEITYSLSLYGGLGDFFYQLSYDASNGEKKTLATLDYGQDLSFTINKDAVKDEWDALSAGTYNPITFAPCYNGVPDTIDAEKVLINTSGFTGELRRNNNGTWTTITGFPTSDNGYTAQGGYGMAERDGDFTEWQMRDLRSYMQRPCLHIPALFDAISNPDNNGGYEVELDGDFFNDDNNPYYSKAYITLPLINELDLNKTDTTGETTVEVLALGWDITNGDYVILSTPSDTGTTLNMTITFKVNVDLTSDSAFTSAYNVDSLNHNCLGGIGLQLVGLDENGNQVAGSDVAWLSSTITGDTYLSFDTAVSSPNTNPFSFYDKVDDYVGCFVKNGNKYAWDTNINLSMTSNVSISRYRIRAVMLQRTLFPQAHQSMLWPNRNMQQQEGGKAYTLSAPTIVSSTYKITGDDISFSNVSVSQESLLTTEYTPADYLLSYCKLFNLYFDKDVFEKKVYIKCQKNYYNGTIDLEYDIHNVFEIQPLSFSHKWYSFNYAAGKSDLIDAYKAKYGTDYGQMRVNTGYEFDSETEDLLKGNVFKNAVDILPINRYFIEAKDANDKVLPQFMLDNVTYHLYNGDGDANDIELGISRSGSYSSINDKSTETIQYDAFNKVQFQSENKPADGANVLLFYNGMKTGLVDYWITDDLAQMFQFNDKATWLWTANEYNGNKQIAIKTNDLPQFSRYISDDKNIYASWDFGRVKELYIPEISYLDGETTIYERYWKAYINDLYDVDTRIVTAYIKFDEKPTKNSLKHFYYFENSYWVIDEIIDYNPTSYDLTKVKFVKVNDPDNYLNQNIIPPTPGPQPLTLEILTGGTIRMYYKSGSVMKYKVNSGEWTTASGSPFVLNVAAGDKVRFKGNSTSNNSFGMSSAYFNAYGNIMSISDGDNFETATTLVEQRQFASLFGMTKLVSAEGLELPATTLTSNCYEMMFFNCSRLTTAPALPATALTQYCYATMFLNCGSLTTAPELPATALASSCYQQMFQNCSGLTAAPALPATTLVSNCYDRMFENCSSINYIKCDATSITANSCTSNWVNGVAETGTFVAPSSMYPTWTVGVNGIPEGWALTGISLAATWTTDMTYVGGTASKDNCTYSVTAYYINGTFGDVTSKATVTGTQNVEASTLHIRHTAGTLNLTASYKGYTASASVTIYQGAAPVTLSISITAPTPIDATATTLSYTVVAGDDCTVKLAGSTLPQDLTNTHPSGATTSSFTIPANTETYEQYFTLNAWLTDHTLITASTSVEQLGASGPTLTGITLDNVTWVTDVPATGGTATYQNCSYTVTAHYSDNSTADITSQAIMSASTELVVSATTSTTRENVGVINVIAFYYDGPNPFSTTRVVSVYQAAYVNPATFYFQNSDTTTTVYGSFGIVRNGSTAYVTGIEARPGMVEDRTDEVPFTITSVALAVSDNNVTQIVTSNSTTGESIIATYDTSANAWKGTGSISVQQGTYIKFDLLRY